MDPTLQQKINWLCEKLSISARCKGTNYAYPVDAAHYCGDTRLPHGPHNFAPDLLKPLGHLMLEKALWERGIEIEIHHIWLTLYPRKGVQVISCPIGIANGDLPLALILAAYDALMEG